MGDAELGQILNTNTSPNSRYYYCTNINGSTDRVNVATTIYNTILHRTPVTESLELPPPPLSPRHTDPRTPGHRGGDEGRTERWDEVS